jgi:hypothetical protein
MFLKNCGITHKEQCIKFKDKAESRLSMQRAVQAGGGLSSTTRKALLEQIYDSVDDNKANLTSAIFERKD